MSDTLSEVAVVIVYFTAEMTILLTLSVFQLMVNNLLPNKSGAIPLIGRCSLVYMLTTCGTTVL